MLQAESLACERGGRLLFKSLEFALAPGTLLRVAGPNGAGKTSLLRILCGLARPAAGRVLWSGENAHALGEEYARRLLYLGHLSAIKEDLSARENLRFFARLLGLPRQAASDALARGLDLAGLTERADDIVATFSGGMQRRLNLACALLHAPRVLLLDEPTVGVDPQSRERVFSAVRAQAAAGTAVLYSTHYMEEAERLCDRVVLIDRGRVVAAGTPAELVRQGARSLRLAVVTRRALTAGWLDGIAAAQLLRADETVGTLARRGDVAAVAIDDLATATRVLERAASLGGDVMEFHLYQPSLQDVFIELTGRDLRD